MLSVIFSKHLKGILFRKFHCSLLDEQNMFTGVSTYIPQDTKGGLVDTKKKNTHTQDFL